MFFVIKHLLNYVLMVSKYIQPFIFRRFELIFSMLLIYLSVGGKSWHLPINQSKTHPRHLGTSVSVQTYLTDAITIIPAYKLLDLSTIVHSELNYSSRISLIVCKARSRTSVSFRCFHVQYYSSQLSFYRICSCRTGIFLTSIEVWNALPRNVCDSVTVRTFKSHLKTPKFSQ